MSDPAPDPPATTSVEIVEVAPRDGLQNESVTLEPAQRAELIRALDRVGFDRIEGVSFVHPDKVPQMAGAEQVVGLVRDRIRSRLTALVLNDRGLRRALDSGLTEVNYVVVSTDEFSRRNSGVDTAAALDGWGHTAESAQAANVRATVTLAAAFGCPFSGEVEPDHVVGLAVEAARARPTELILADTIGVAGPSAVSQLVRLVRQAVPDVPVRLHLHNTRNTGFANAYAGVLAGAGALDASLGGIGGCPFAPAATGNIATEDLAYLLHRSGVTVDLDVTRAVTLVDQLETWLDKPTPGLLAKAGWFGSSPTVPDATGKDADA